MITREQRILRIISTLRPTDPTSWEPNTHYVTLEFNEHDAEQRQQIEQQVQEIERLTLALAEIGNIAVVDWDGATVGKVDKALESVPKTYMDVYERRCKWVKEQAQEIAKLREALNDCLEQVREDIRHIGPCEHDVNICVCGLRALATQAQAALKEQS